MVVTAGEEDTTGIWWVEPWGAAQRPAVRGLPSQQRVSGPKCEPFTPSVPLSHSVHPGNRSVQPPGTLFIEYTTMKEEVHTNCWFIT